MSLWTIGALVLIGCALVAFSPIGIFARKKATRREARASLEIARGLIKAMTLLSTIAVVVVLIVKAHAIWVGAQVPPLIDASTNVVSVALLGSLLSAGGISLVSLEGELSEVRQSSESVTRRCPFTTLWKLQDGSEFIVASDPLHRPGNPMFCRKCPLGIDHTRDAPTRLIHVCGVYDDLHREWLQLPGAPQRLQAQVG